MELRDLVNSVIMVLSEIVLVTWLTFLLKSRLWLSQTCCFGFISIFWCKYLLYKSFSSIRKFWSCCFLSFHWFSNELKTRCLVSSHSLWLSCADWDGLPDDFRDVPWKDIFKLSASTVASEFCEWVQVGIDVYISHCKYQITPHLSLWFSAACAAVIVCRNHFFHLY